jgi:hypothetical protein
MGRREIKKNLCKFSHDILAIIPQLYYIHVSTFDFTTHSGIGSLLCLRFLVDFFMRGLPTPKQKRPLLFSLAPALF